MSILPSRNLVVKSSSSSPSQSPNSKHGIVSSSELEQQSQLFQSHIALSDQAQILKSLQISNPQSSGYLPGSLAAGGEDSDGSSKEVMKLGEHNGESSLIQQNGGRNSQREAAYQTGKGSAEYKGNLSDTIVSPHLQSTSMPANCYGTAKHSAGRKHQGVSGNHLLNFHYSSVSHSYARTPPPRRQPKRKPYNKDLFLQANYKFVLLDSGDYAPETMHPDKMLQWEDIVLVKYSSAYPVHCPICLEDPLCPQITSCGHIFCFPCILRYFFIGEDDHKGECWKKCPLCFMMISSKDLCTVYIENVKQHLVGDTIDFMLLSRQKDSFTLSLKNKQRTDADENMYDSFSKFTFTSDVDLSVREAMLDLDSWLARADSGLVDDLVKLPYVCAAMEQLQQRKKFWNDRQAGNASKGCTCDSSGSHEHTPLVNATSGDEGTSQFICRTLPSPLSAKSMLLENDMQDGLDGTSFVIESFEEQDGALSSPSEDRMSVHLQSNRIREQKDSYSFYQAVDGQHLILHPLNMKCFLNYYGNSDRLPHRISGKILQLEAVTQNEAIRRRYRFLSHFSLTTTFQFCEIDLSDLLPPDALSPFMDEIKNRERQRKWLTKKEREEKMKAESSTAHFVPVMYDYSQSLNDDLPNFSIDDFEALGSSNVTSSCPPNVGERKLFSNVTRLGFAAAHDSPALKVNEAHPPSKIDVPGSSTIGTPSFANVISRARPIEATQDASKVTETGKKGKKPTRVLLSNSGGRRY